MTAVDVETASVRGRGLVGALLAATLALAAAGAAGVLRMNAEPEATPSRSLTITAEAVARGAYIARLGNCAGCHTARGAADYAGGRALPTPFGTVFASNITPDANTGLGRWSADDFWRALHYGRSRDGHLLAPAFPYDQFTLVTRADSDALYAYLRSLRPIEQVTPPSGLRFPFGTQAALAVWRALYFRPADIKPSADAGRSASWRRGAYLVRGLGHCSACHAPRNALGATVAADDLAGGAPPMQPWFAPALAPDSGDLVLERQSLIDFLRSGQSAHVTAIGPMAEVVFDSTQYWSAADLAAAADYLLSLPAAHDRANAVQLVTPARRQNGARVYADHCESCHGEQGQGVPGVYPPLAGNPTVTMADPSDALLEILFGGFAPATQANPRPYGMPPTFLSAEDLADLLTYLRQSWGNQASAVTAQFVLRER